MSTHNKHKVSKKELDNLLGQAFLNLDFNNPKNQKLMETISSQYMINNTLTINQKLKRFIVNKITVSIVIVSIISVIIVAYYFSSQAPESKNNSITNQKQIIENYKPKTEIVFKKQKAIEQKHRDDSALLKQTVMMGAIIDNSNTEIQLPTKITPEINNTETSNNIPQKSEFLIDTSYVFPTLTEKEIKANAKQKKRMIELLAKLSKGEYSPIPMGTFDYKGKKVSLGGFYMRNCEVTNLEYRTFLFDLLINGRKEEFLKAKPTQSQWVNYLKGSLFLKPMEENYFSHPAYNNYPVVNISKIGAEMYCLWLTIETNNYLTYKNKPLINDLRIPTVTEWVYAAKGGENAEYPWGTDKIQNIKNCYLANINIEKNRNGLNLDCEYIKYKDAATSGGLMLGGGTTVVMAYAYNPSKWGLYCLTGNVGEMTYEQDENLKPTNTILLKGGGWNSSYEECKISYEEKFNDVLIGNPTTGFRPIITTQKTK